MYSGPGLAFTAYVRPYDQVHDRFARYYFEGIRRHLAAVGGRYREVSMGRAPEVLRAMHAVRRAYRLRPLFTHVPAIARGLDAAAARIEGPLHPPSGHFVDLASHGVLTLPDGREVKITIQSDDEGARIDRPTLVWSDVCFKTNYWPSLRYPSKVVPCVNGDPLVIPQLGAFRAARATPKRYDLCMVVRVWGGTDEVEGVEHNLRLIEAVSRAPCRKFLYAYLVAGDIEASRRRLARQGIPSGVHPVPPAELWRITAESRLNVIRLGMHHCIPWRVTGALAIGSAVVLDRAPFTRWPEPLVEGEHFVALDTRTGVDQPLATDAEYAAVPEKIAAWLADPALSERLGRRNADYFDRFASPERVGEHIVETAARFSDRIASARRSSPPPPPPR